jgi:hypothetical protein
VLNSENPLVSTDMHPLARYPLYKGGCADADWCVKHCLATAVKQTTNKSKGFFREVMRMIRLFRNKFIWVEVRAQASAIFAAEGSYELDDVDQALCDALGQDRIEKIKLNNPRGLALPVEACETRWGLLYAGAALFYKNLLLFSALAPLALAEGTRKNKIEAMKEVCNKGFVDKKKIAYENARVGRAIFYMSQPDFILRLAIVRFLHVICWQPCMAATAHRHDCSMTKVRGLGSVFRTVHWVLTRGIWASFAIPVKKDGVLVSQKPWKMQYKVGHRGPAEAKLIKGIMCLFLSARLEDGMAWRVRGKEKDMNRTGNNKTISPLQHLFGDFYTPEMADAITDLQNAIREVCQMSIAEEQRHIAVMLPKERRTHYLRNKKASARNFLNPLGPTHTSLHFRIQQSTWMVYQETSAAAKALLEKFKLTLNDPMGFLAGMVGVETHRLIENGLSLDHGNVRPFYTSSCLARANAAVLHLQVREILQHNPRAGQYVNAPLRTVFQKSFLKKLKIFSLGESVASVLNGFGVLASDETGHTPDLSTLLFPVNYYKDLAEAAVLAGARITHSNDVESRWSILTGKYMSGMRNAGPLCLSQYARQPDYHTFGMKEFIHTGKFYDDVCAASSFRRQNFNEIQLLHEVRDNEIHKKKVQLREQRAKEDFNESNISCGTKTAKEQTLKDPKKKGRGERKSQPRNQDNQLDGSSGSESGSKSMDEWECSESDAESMVESDSDDSSFDIPISGSDSDDGNLGERQDSGRGCHSEDGSLPDARNEPTRRSQRIIENTENRAPVVTCADPEEGRDDLQLQQQDDIAAAKANKSEPEPASTSAPAPPAGSGQELEVRSEEGDCDWTIHPIQVKSELDSERAQKLSKYRLNYTRWLLKGKKWVRTQVHFSQRNRSDLIIEAKLTRFDDLKFDLVTKGQVFYILYTPAGLELINIQSLRQSERQSDLIVSFNRVLSTERAIKAAHSREDLQDGFTSADGRVITSIRLGSNNLNIILKSHQDRDPTVVHAGDILYTDHAYNIVGVVGWLTQNACGNDDKRLLLSKFRTVIGITPKQAKDISCFDVVIQGQPFSESVPPE